MKWFNTKNDEIMRKNDEIMRKNDEIMYKWDDVFDIHKWDDVFEKLELINELASEKMAYIKLCEERVGELQKIIFLMLAGEINGELESEAIELLLLDKYDYPGDETVLPNSDFVDMYRERRG